MKMQGVWARLFISDFDDAGFEVLRSLDHHSSDLLDELSPVSAIGRGQ
jgi:hypothetical protein